MLSWQASFEPILENESFPLHSLSLTENKLVKKAVNLARLLAGKSCFLGEESFEGRRRLLLMATMRISSALGETAMIFKDDRVAEVVDVLAHFSLDYLSQLDWIDIEEHEAKVQAAKRLIGLFAWRREARQEPSVNVPKLLRHIEPFIHALDRRAAFEQALQAFDQIRLKHRLAVWSDTLALQRMRRFQLALSWTRWKQLARKERAAGKINESYLTSKYVRKWRAGVKGRRRDEELAARLLWMRGVDPRGVALDDSSGMLERASNMGLLAGAMQAWRGLTRAKRFEEAKSADIQRGLLALWLSLTNKAAFALKSAEFHDKIRIVRPIFAGMLLQSRRFNEAVAYLAEHARLSQCYGVLAKWRRAVKLRQIKRRYFDTFTRKSRFLIAASEHARKLSRITAQLRCIQAWKSRCRNRLSKMETLKEKESMLSKKKAGIFFSHWRVRAQHHHSHGQMVEAWRAKEEKRDIFKKWKARAIVEHNCKTFHLRSVYIGSMRAWRGALAAREDCKRLTAVSFAKWRQHAKAIKASKFFAGSQLARYSTHPTKTVPSNVLIVASKVQTLGQAGQLGLVARTFQAWHGSVSAAQKAYSQFMAGKKRLILKQIRIVLRLHERSDKVPVEAHRHAWSRFKQACTRSRQRSIVLGLRLEEHFGSQEFLLHFRYFKIWEGAFQVRKMEEHLCEQNLASYHHGQKLMAFRGWKRLTAQKMFQQYTALVNGRKAALAQWRDTTRRVASARNGRVLARSIATWRDALKAKRADGLSNTLLIRRVGCAFRKWCRAGRDKYALSQVDKIATPWFIRTGPPPVPRFHD